jgi:tRNA(fMet)-specific endonuclease VapC
VSVTALERCLLRANTPSKYTLAYMGLRQDLALLNVDDAIAQRAARVGSRLSTPRRRLSTADLLIAATALEHNLSLVTHHTAAFVGVPGLIVVDWLAP